MFGLKTTLKALLCSALLLAAVTAAPTADAPNVEVSAEFPNAIQGLTPSLISGDSNKLKVTFRNSGKTDLKVNLIVGTVSEPDDFSNVIRNLTAYRYSTTLKAEATLVLPYTIQMEHKSTEVGLSLYADLSDSAKNHFQVVVYNSTVTFSEPVHSWIDPQLIFLYVLIAGIFFAIGSFVKGSVTPESKKKAKAPSMTPEERAAAEEKAKTLDEDWIPDHHKKSPHVTKRR
ncbi:MAG: translocon-associated protein [Benniella sp.]|nr:MAG: translocon-associated protein [Benniella sp.]